MRSNIHTNDVATGRLFTVQASISPAHTRIQCCTSSERVEAHAPGHAGGATHEATPLSG